jgi:glycosyltransferase involved in cell wall biosynthesis
MRRAFREVKPDLALSFTVHANILTLLAGRGLRVPIAVSERADPGLYKIGPVWELLRRLTYRWAEVLICQTHSSLNWFRKHYGVNGCVIPNPASVPAGADGGALIRGSNQGNTVVAMGRLSFEKGFDLLLSAFAQIAGRHPEWSLKIIGDGPLRSQLLAQCRELKLSGRVDFPGGLSEPFPLLRSADLFVLPSRFEGFPNALCEAMAVGLPAISFDCPSGPAEIIRDGIDGMLVPPQDIEGLASALDLLMGNRALRTQLGMRAREVTARFSLQKVLRMWEDVFRTVRDQRKVGRDTLREEGDLRHDSQRSINQQVLGRRYRE